MWQAARLVLTTSRGLGRSANPPYCLFINKGEKLHFLCWPRSQFPTASSFSVTSQPQFSLRLSRFSGTWRDLYLPAWSNLHTNAALSASNIIQFPLAQTGEGIKECELTEWYVEVRRSCFLHLPRPGNNYRLLGSILSTIGHNKVPYACVTMLIGCMQQGSRVEEFQKICEVQSDKAAVEITSRYAGVVKKLHHTIGDLVQVETLLQLTAYFEAAFVLHICLAYAGTRCQLLCRLPVVLSSAGRVNSSRYRDS